LSGPPDRLAESEECLTLNIWSRGLNDGGKRPVMVWYHGGGFSYGSSNMPRLDGTNLAAQHDVVVVTVNQRLNILGHLHLADIGGEAFAQSGNAGTLDMLNRGEIAMGPVWVDMFYTWKAEGKLPPNTRLKLVAPGMPGQPMYYAVPAKTGQEKLAAEFIALATSPEVQAEGIVKKFNWYPGIDAKNVQSKLDKADWDKLFVDITPESLATNGKAFPIGPYFNDILETYEKKVAN